jgi:hypothetical protein
MSDKLDSYTVSLIEQLKVAEDELRLANARVAELEANLSATDREYTRAINGADRAGLELAKQLETAERKVKRCVAVLSRRYSEPGHWENPAGDLCSADELEAALEDK